MIRLCGKTYEAPEAQRGVGTTRTRKLATTIGTGSTAPPTRKAGSCGRGKGESLIVVGHFALLFFIEQGNVGNPIPLANDP